MNSGRFHSLLFRRSGDHLPLDGLAWVAGESDDSRNADDNKNTHTCGDNDRDHRLRRSRGNRASTFERQAASAQLQQVLSVRESGLRLGFSAACCVYTTSTISAHQWRSRRRSWITSALGSILRPCNIVPRYRNRVVSACQLNLVHDEVLEAKSGFAHRKVCFPHPAKSFVIEPLGVIPMFH